MQNQRPTEFKGFEQNTQDLLLVEPFFKPRSYNPRPSHMAWPRDLLPAFWHHQTPSCASACTDNSIGALHFLLSFSQKNSQNEALTVINLHATMHYNP